jgi:mRNA interferase MazF
VKGSEQGGERPVLVLSPDIINDYAPVLVVAAITSRKTDRVYPFEAGLRPPEGGLQRPSKVMMLHVRGIARERIVGRCGSLSAEALARVDAALRIATGLEGV